MNHNLILDRAKAQESLAKKKEAAKELKQDFLDMPTWRELSSKYSFRLPSYYQPSSSTKYLKRLAKHLGFDIKEYLEDSGVTTVKQLVSLNENYPAYAECGLMLEWWDEKQAKVG